MSSILKTAVTADKSSLVDGEPADAGDVIVAVDDLIDNERAGRASNSATDLYVKHLNDWLQAGEGISKTTNNPGADETVTVASDSRVKVSSNDTGRNFLENQIGVGTGMTQTTENDGADELVRLGLHQKFIDLFTNYLMTGGKIPISAIDSTGITAGYSAQAAGDGTTSFQAEAGGGATPVDETVTAGEALALRDRVYLNRSDGKWYKVDTDATPPKISSKRGVVNESGGIAQDATGSVRTFGEVGGFTGLTAHQPVYSSTTAGGYTQTRPNPAAGAGQIVIDTIGDAINTTTIFVEKYEKVVYLKREILSLDETTTIQHHSDPAGRKRKARTFISSTQAGVSLATYASSNQDVNVLLRASGAGATTTVDSAGAIGAILGNSSGQYRVAQSFQVTAGALSQIVVRFGLNVGSPTGDLTWEIRSDNSGSPSSTVLQSGTHTITASADNTINVTGGIFLNPSTTYWLVLSVPAQSSGNYYQPVYNNSNPYANGVLKQDIDSANTWDALAAGSDLRCEITTAAVTSKDKLAQSFQVSGSQTVDTAKLWLRRVGSPAGTMTLRIETDNSGSPSGTLVDANATVTVGEGSVATSYGWITFDFATNFSLSGSTTYWLVLSTSRSASGTDYIQWGADASTPGYASGEMKSEVSAAWGAESKDAVFDVVAPGTVFDGEAVCDFWEFTGSKLVHRFADADGANGDTYTTFKSIVDEYDVTCMVEVFNE